MGIIICLRYQIMSGNGQLWILVGHNIINNTALNKGNEINSIKNLPGKLNETYDDGMLYDDDDDEDNDEWGPTSEAKLKELCRS